MDYIYYFIVLVLFCCFFFFFSSRRRHTRSKRDWSSDVCSSDLGFLRKPWWVGPLVAGVSYSHYSGGKPPEPPAVSGYEVRSEERRVGKECRCRWAEGR